MSKRVLQFSSTLQRVVADILLREAEDPLLKTVTISRVEMTTDLKIARIYVSSWKNNPEELLASLEKARHFLLKEISRRIICKFLPKISFLYDYGFEMEEKIKQFSVSQIKNKDSCLKE